MFESAPHEPIEEPRKPDAEAVEAGGETDEVEFGFQPQVGEDYDDGSVPLDLPDVDMSQYDLSTGSIPSDFGAMAEVDPDIVSSSDFDLGDFELLELSMSLDSDAAEGDALGRCRPNHLQSEARMLAMSEPSPAIRLEMLGGMVEEGDHDMASFAVSTLRELPDFKEGSEVNEEKIVGARILVGKLASQGMFEDAEAVVSLLEGLDQHAAIRSVTSLLGAGYAGTDDRYLHFDFSAYIEEAQAANKSPDMIVFDYIDGLAAHGVNLLDPQTEHGTLFFDAISALPDSSRRDCRYSSVSFAYTTGGHIDKAVAIREIIQDPYWRSLAGIKIAERSETDKRLAKVMLTEASALASAVRCCDGQCGRRSCNPQIDSRTIDTGMALAWAKQGDTARARELVGDIVPACVYSQAEANMLIYSDCGDLSARREVLKCVSHKPALVAALMQEIGEADMKWGQVMSSLEADGEFVPLVLWEVHDIYGQKGYREQRIESQGLDTEQYRTMEILGVDPSTRMEGLQDERLDSRDSALVELAKTIAITAPATADSLIRLIHKPSERVRAMVGVERRRSRP